MRYKSKSSLWAKTGHTPLAKKDRLAAVILKLEQDFVSSLPAITILLMLSLGAPAHYLGFFSR